MRVAILSPNYHTARLFEMLLVHEQHTATCFGRLTRLEQSKKLFDLLLFDPGDPEFVEDTLERLAHWRPKVRRLLFTHSADVSEHARRKKLPVLFLPCSRRHTLFLIQAQKSAPPKGVSHGS